MLSDPPWICTFLLLARSELVTLLSWVRLWFRLVLLVRSSFRRRRARWELVRFRLLRCQWCRLISCLLDRSVLRVLTFSKCRMSGITCVNLLVLGR